MQVASLAAMASLALAGPAWGATYYVDDTGGNDGRTTTEAQNPATPWATMAKCAATMVAGDTCLIRAGAYGGAVLPAASGTAGAGITYAAYPGERLVFSGEIEIDAKHYLTIEGLECTGGTNSCVETLNQEGSPSSHITIRNLYGHDIVNPALGDNTAAIRLDACQDCLVEDFVCENVANFQGGSINYRGQNATCILSYNAWGTTIRRMTCKNTGTCIFLKEAPEKPAPHATISGVVCENAQICVRASVAGKWGPAQPSSGSPWKGVHVTDSICKDLDSYCFVENAADADYDPEEGPLDDLRLANLTIDNVGDHALIANGWTGPNGVQIYNNCFVSGGATRNAYDSNSVTKADYNLFLTSRDRAGINGASYTSLAAIQAGTAFEDHGQVVADVDFIPGTYRIRPTSPAWQAGRSDGTPSGSVVHACAPADHSTVIGVAPAAPTVP